MTQYTSERWHDIIDEMRPLLTKHWLEIACDQDEFPLDIKEEKYSALDSAGILHIVAARQDGKLIGYHLAIISEHLHHSNILHAITDVYWVAPEKRHGITAMRLFQKVEDELKKLGVKRFYTATPVKLNQSRFFEHIGYRPVELLCSKLL